MKCLRCQINDALAGYDLCQRCMDIEAELEMQRDYERQQERQREEQMMEEEVAKGEKDEQGK